jgi:hypothetical protein
MQGVGAICPLCLPQKKVVAVACSQVRKQGFMWKQVLLSFLTSCTWV